MWSLADRLKRLERELGLAAAPSPFDMDPKIIRRRVEATLSAEEAERKCYMKHKIRLAAALTAVTLAFTGTALAAGPTLADVLRETLGGFLPYAQPQENMAEDQGIRVKVVSALADQTTLRIYAEITDLTEDRLENAKIDGLAQLKLEGERMYTSSSDLIRYDKETKTALMCFSRYTGVPLPDEMQTTLRIIGLQPDYHRFSADSIPLELISPSYAKEQTLETGEVVLVPGQTNYALTGEKAAGVVVSSIGFASDGRLHILFQFPGTVENGHGICSVYSNSWEKGSGTGDVKFNQDFQSTLFTEGGVTYYDHASHGAPEELGDIKELAYPGGVYLSSSKIEGTWEVPVTIKRMADVTSPLTGLIDHNTLQELVLSPYGVIIRSTSTDYTLIEGYPLTVFLADGTTLHPKVSMTGGDADYTTHFARWEFEDAVEVTDITGVALGCWMIPVENGVAGEGYWLPALPE